MVIKTLFAANVKSKKSCKSAKDLCRVLRKYGATVFHFFNAQYLKAK